MKNFEDLDNEIEFMEDMAERLGNLEGSMQGAPDSVEITEQLIGWYNNSTWFADSDCDS